MATGYPALMIRPPESPVEQLGQVLGVKSELQQQQLQQVQIQQAQRQLSDQNAITKSLLSWDGTTTDPRQLAMTVLKNGGSGQAVFQVAQQLLARQQSVSEIAKNDAMTNQANADVQAKQNDALRGRILNVAGITDPAAKQAAWDAEVTKEEQAGTVKPGTISHQYPGDDAANALANQYALGSKLMEEAQNKQKLAVDAWKPAGGGLQNVITGEKIGGIPDTAPLNTGFQARWNVLHPGETIPPEFQLKTGANPADFDRIDKLLEATEKGEATAAQREQTNAIRQQTFEIARDKQDMNAVQGIDPKTGATVMVPYGQAQQMGIQNPLKASDDVVNKALAARHWLNLANTKAPDDAKPEDMGIMQLVDKLDAEGKLGPVASRWNEFMAGKVGAGDPEISALRTKMGLSTTLLQQAHVGNRGSSQMLEHFEDLANQKKLDGPTLKASLGAEVNYVTDRAMDPNPPNYNQQAAKPVAATAAKPTAFKVPEGAPAAPAEDGHKLKQGGNIIAVSKGGQWVEPSQ
jgi:hypothetical protein